MTTRRILGCVLLAAVCLMTGCSLFADPGTNETPKANSNPSPNMTTTAFNWNGVSSDVNSLIIKLNAPSRPEPTVTKIQTEVNEILKKLGKDKDNFERMCMGCNAQSLSKTEEARTSLLAVITRLKEQQADARITQEIKSDILPHLRDSVTQLKEANDVSVIVPSAQSPLATPTQSPSESPIKTGGEASFLDWLVLPAKILGAVLLLVLLAIGLMYLWQHSWKSVEINVARMVTAHSAAARDGQPDYTQKIASLSSAQKEMSNSLMDLHTEIRSLARLVRESMSDRNDGRRHPTIPSYQNPVEEFSSKAEPEFPVSAFDYLGKMDRFANVVRPDFQNGILVNAPDGKGELMLIRDSRLPDETQPLFVVPRTTQFQTKQDFYTYYEKYYDCVRPSAGDVWIIDPAVVEKVSGGWQLREKGVLEVR